MNKQLVQKDLDEFISIQSVSTDSTRFSEILMAVDFLNQKLSSLGFMVKVIEHDQHPPLIIAERIISKRKRTIGIYGHYDVQPEDPADEWKSEPFKLTLREGKFFARGVADDKGHIIQNIAAIESLIEEKGLYSNVIFILEGEEECGSVYLEEFVASQKAALSKIDVFFITDTGMFAKWAPQIFYALRGLVYFEITVKIGDRDLHSGVYGNRVFNPIQVLTDLFAKMKDINTGKILIPGFYDNMRKIPKHELELLEKTEVSPKDLEKEAGVYRVVAHNDTPPYLASKILPSLDVHGIQGGYTSPGVKTVIPRQASAKFSCRIVENQDPQEVVKLIQRFIKDTIPVGVTYDLTVHSAEGSFYTSLDNEYAKKTAAILAEHFGHETMFNRSGGSIPAAEIMQRLFKKPVILSGFTLPDENMHSPNENFDEEMFWEGIDALKKIYGSI